MPEPTIGLAMIVRDAEAGLRASLDSVKEQVDQIVIVLAGKSKDKTAAIAREYTSEVYDFEWCDDFAAARNFSFGKLTTDYTFWLDADDVLIGGEHLRRHAEEAERRGYGAFHFQYAYRHDDQGNVTVVHNRERLLKRSLGWRWVWRVHEYLKTETPHLVGFSDEIIVKHTNNKANTERNLRLLRMIEQEMSPDDPEYPRLLGCLMDIHQSEGKFDEAIAYGERFFEAEHSTGLKWTAATELARSYQKRQDWPMVVHWSHVALSLHPEYALPCLLLAHAAWFGEQNPEKALLYFADADNRLEAPTTVFRQPLDYTLNRWDVEHRCYAALERWEEALRIVGKGIELAGAKKDWYYFVWLYQERINGEHSMAGLQALADHFCQRGDTLHALKLVEECAPIPLRQDPRYLRLRHRLRQITAHVFDDRAYDAFYNDNHSSKTDPDCALNATAPEPFRLDPLIERLKKRGAKRILDVGCGAGEPAIYIAKAGFEVVGIDINRKAITEARRRAKRATKGNGLKAWQLEFRLGSLDTHGPEDLGQFDAVIMMELIEHVTPAKAHFFLASAEDFLRDGGAVFVTTPAMLCGDLAPVWKEGFRDHVYEYDQAELERMFIAPGKRTRLPMTLHRVYDFTAHSPGFASWLMEYEMRQERPAWPEWEQPVAIYVGQGLEAWDPTTPDETGLGGSETWAAKVARELRAMGHPVVVYAATSGVWDGVIYRDAALFDPQAPFLGERAWLCIVSRHLEMLDERPNAEHVAFIAHDTDYGDALNQQRLDNLDVYAVMSRWQEEHTFEVYESAGLSGLFQKIKVIQNGIEPSFFEGEEARQPHSFLWASSPDRGLDRLLEWWPSIREMWPDASLSIAYGWQNVDALSNQRPWLQPFKQRVLELSRQPGVKWIGRIGQKALAREWMKTQFWLYPSRLPEELGGGPWHETFCITALEAAAGGCVGIFPDVGALHERPGLLGAIRGDMTGEEIALLLPAFEGGFIYHNAINPDEWSWRAAAEWLLEVIPATETELVSV
jgi:2-polyprenyl-3-methyl-5-hydroxy-6-metoxy-1,4-benzoquinol methylase